MAKVLVSETSGWENVHRTAQDCTGVVKFHMHTTVRQTAQACEGMCAQECARKTVQKVHGTHVRRGLNHAHHLMNKVG